MLTSKRIKRFLRAVELDDDDIVGKEKDSILESLLLLTRKYERYEKSSSDSFIIKSLKSRINKKLSDEDQAEAIDIIFNCIEEDSRVNHLPVNMYSKVEVKYLGEILDAYEENEDNVLLAKQALFLVPYNPKMHRKHTKKHKKSLLSSGELSEEELLDEIG